MSAPPTEYVTRQGNPPRTVPIVVRPGIDQASVDRLTESLAAVPWHEVHHRKPSSDVQDEHVKTSGDEQQAEWQRIAVYVVCRDEQNRILLTHLDLPGLPAHDAWTLPGGGMEWGERPEDTAVRELDEETGLRAELGPVIGIWSDWLQAHETVRGTPGHAVGILFEGRRVEGELRTDFPDGSTDGAAWFGPEEVAALQRVPLVDFALGLVVDRSA